jgi:hypothetical protein
MDTIESLEEQETFFLSVHDRFLNAAASVGAVNFYYSICDTSVCLSFAGEELVPHITPALNHLMIPEVEKPDLTVCLWDSVSTRTSMVPPPWKRDRYTYRGDIWGYNSGRIKTAFHWIEFSLNMLDFETNTGLFWVEHTRSLPFWVNASPLRTLFHWWMEKNGCQLVHAAAVGTENGAVLLTGKGGIGKSTAALSCLKSGFFYLGDDYIVTRMRPEPYVYTLYNTAKLNADHVKNFPEISRLISNAENLKDEKAVIFLYPEFGGQLVRAMPLKGVVVPHVTDHSESGVTRISSENVLRAASFTTMTQLPGAGIKTYEFLNQLSAGIPCFSLESGRDLSHIPVAISGLLRTLSDGKIADTLRRSTGEQRLTPKAWPVMSIIVPVFNGERFIREAVESIVSQGYPSLEIIVIDDGSTDRTRDIIEELPFEVRYFRQDNLGPAAARSKGIREATGEFVAFIDVDDLWPKNNLHMLAKELLADKDVDVVHGYAQLARYNDVTHECEYTGNPAESFPYYIGAALYRRSVFTKVGLFDPTLLYGEDTDWFKRAEELKINIRRLEDVTLIVRRHGKNMTSAKDMVELNHLRVFKKSLDRMRARRQADHVLP